MDTLNLSDVAFKALEANGCDCKDPPDVYGDCLACVCEAALVDLRSANEAYKYALRSIAAVAGANITQEEWSIMTPETALKIKNHLTGGEGGSDPPLGTVYVNDINRSSCDG